MQPQFATIENWSAMTGLGRTHVYHLLSAGHLRAVKAGRRTLIDVEHGLAWMRSRPAAEIHCTPARRARA